LTRLISRWQAILMDLQEFRDSVSSDQPPKNLNFALSGLWWDGKGDWARAHESAQQDEGRPVRGHTRTCTVKRAILRMLRTGISVRASLRAAVRSKMSGLQSRMRCFDDLRGNAGCCASRFC